MTGVQTCALPISSRHILNHKYLLSLAAIHLNDGAFKVQGFEFDEEALWVFGDNSRNLWENLPARESLNGYKSFPDVGWYVIRYKKDYCIISCGPNGGDGWHSHNDKLSFELMIDGQDVIVDPGTYVYTSKPEARNLFRSTEYHNTIKFEGYEQNDINEETFLLRDKVEIINAGLEETDDKIMFTGEIQYEGIKHRRVIMFKKEINEWQIKDSITCPSTMNARLLFHLAPGITFDGKNLLNKTSHEKIASILVEGYELTKDKYEYSPEYGVKVEADSLYAIISCDKRNTDIISKIRRVS